MKKILAGFLAVLMLLSGLSMLVGAQDFINDDTYTVGNADDSDDSVNAKDTYLVRQLLNGNIAAGEKINKDAADLNADGIINLKDSMLLKNLISGNISEQSLDSRNQVYRFTIGGVDISEFSISVPEDCGRDSNAYYTAEILKKYISVATGVSLRIVQGRPEGHRVIAINAVDRWSELGEKLGNESYIYEVKDGNLELYGTYRGNMYAAYEIIEDYLGFRFFDGTYTFLYKSRYVDIPADTYVFFEPYLRHRHTGQNTGALETYYLPSRQNSSRSDCHTDNLRYGQFYGPQFCNAHSYGLYWRMATGTFPDESFGTLEERYEHQYNTGYQQNELSWQPCATLDSVYQTLFKGLVDTMARMQSWKGHPWGYDFIDDNGDVTEYVKSKQTTMSFSICDNGNYCLCRFCTKKAHTEGYSGLYIDLANRAARDIQAYYPGMRIHSILYDHDIPKTVRPDKNLIVYYCGQGCNNHFINSGECGDCLGQLGRENNVKTSASLKAWGQMCAETGAEMWYWYYGVTYHYYLVGLPCIFNLYHDYKFLYEECNVKGINYEGGGRPYNFETLKAYLSTRLEWNPTMSYDEFIAHMKEYLYMYYGDGYEKIYEFIVMENEAGDRCGTCFISNFDRPGDMYSYAYIAEHYEYMRALLTEALAMADREDYKSRIKTLICCFDFLGLSSVYDEMYTNGGNRALYEERYTAMYNYIVDNKMSIFSDPVTYTVPKTCDFTVNPMTQFYENGSRRPGVKP